MATPAQEKAGTRVIAPSAYRTQGAAETFTSNEPDKVPEKPVIPKSNEQSSLMQFEGIVLFKAPNNPELNTVIGGHATRQPNSIVQRARLGFWLQNDFYSNIELNIEILQTGFDDPSQESLQSTQLRQYHLYLGTSHRRDDELSIVSYRSKQPTYAWRKSIIEELINAADRAGLPSEHLWLQENWQREELQLYVFTFVPEHISVGNSNQEHVAADSYRALEEFFTTILPGQQYKDEVFRCYFVMKNSTTKNKETKIKKYSDTFLQEIVRFERRCLHETQYPPALSYWKDKTALLRMKGDVLKPIEQQPKIEFRHYDSYPFYDQFIHQLSVAVLNEISLEKQRELEASKHLVNVQIIKFASDEHGIYVGLIVLPDDLPVQIKENDRLTIKFEPDIGTVWKARVGVWNASVKGPANSLQVILTAPSGESILNQESESTIEHVSALRPPSIFSIEQLGRDEKKSVDAYRKYLKSGSANKARISVVSNDKVHKADIKAVSILNLYDEAEDDDKQIAKDFKDILLGHNTRLTSLPMPFYPASYDVLQATTGPELEALEKVTGTARCCADFTFAPEQLEVIRSIGAKGKITLLQGGAGTSKSETEVAVVIQAVKAGKRVIVACPQNVIADDVVVSIQKVLNEACPGKFAGRWVLQKSQISHSLYVARGGTTRSYWRVPDATEELLSEEAAEVADSVRNIHNLTHGTKDKRFQAVDYVPIHKFAKDRGIVDFEPQTSYSSRRKATSISLESMKATLQEYESSVDIEPATSFTNRSKERLLAAQQAAIVVGNTVARQGDILETMCEQENVVGLTASQFKQFGKLVKSVLAGSLEQGDFQVLVMTTFALSDKAVQAFNPDLIITTEA